LVLLQLLQLVERLLISMTPKPQQAIFLEIKSDTQDQVIATQGGLDPVLMPHDAELVSWIHPAWTASIPGADWIWATDPTIPEEESIDVIYIFQKKFEWWGPISGVTLNLDVGADNSYEVWLNGVKVAGDNTERNYNATGQDQYTDGVVLTNIKQGQNTIEFKVKNWARPVGQTWANPGGLLYKLVIDGQCEDDYFKTHCTLWGEKDLEEGDSFFNFEDVKPGDRGRNVISVHVYDNDAWLCMVQTNQDDQENVITDPEAEAGDETTPAGELSQYLTMFAWRDDNGDGAYDPPSETEIDRGTFYDLTHLAVYDSTVEEGSLTATTTQYIGLAWCAGEVDVNGETGEISCDGSAMGDMAQTDSFAADLNLFAEQVRNNTEFQCVDVSLEED